jgi:hypothetical protein
MFMNVLTSPLIRPLIWAISLHLIFFIIFPKTRELGQEHSLLKPVEILTLTSSEIKNYRTVGTKGGKKEFSIPIKNFLDGNGSTNNPTQITEKKDLSISNIANPRILYPPQKITKELFPKMIGPGMPSSSLNIGFEPPEGVSETELNSTEKIYYSFSKRTYEIYINSLITSFNKLMREKPDLDLTIPDLHNLTGRILFNQEGKAVDTQFFIQSKNENLQELFENTLMDMRNIPNPPKGLLNPDGTFAVHYRLQVGN